MRRIALVVLGLSLAFIALAENANARPRGLPGALLGAITKPFGAIFGNAGRMSRRGYNRRSASRTRSPAPVAAETRRAAPAATAGQAAPAAASQAATGAAPAAMAAGAVGAATVAATAGAGTAPSAEPVVGTAPSADPAPAVEAAAPPASPTPAQPTAAPATEATAPPQRSAAPAADAAPAASPMPAQRTPTQRTAAPAGEAAAPSQRSAALSQPTEQQLEPPPQRRGREAARTARSAPQAAPAPVREPSQLGVVGPQTWPNAYEDILGFTLWPDKYGERLKAHGIGDVMSVMFAPPGGLAAAGRQTVARADGANPSDADGAGAFCSSVAPSSADWPTRQIEQSIQLTDAQRTAIAQLRTAVSEGVAAIKAVCRDDARTSADRLRAMERTLWTVRDATILIRAPLVNFYGSLTAEQKKQFIVQVSQPDPRMAQMDPRAQGRGGQQAIPPQLARMCGMSGANEWPLRQIEQSIRPNRAQRASLETLQKKSGEMGQLLMASCLQATAAAPEARLDAAVDRLTALLFAITNVTLAFNDFYGQLSDEQKTQLGSFGL